MGVDLVWPAAPHLTSSSCVAVAIYLLNWENAPLKSVRIVRKDIASKFLCHYRWGRCYSVVAVLRKYSPRTFLLIICQWFLYLFQLWHRLYDNPFLEAYDAIEDVIVLLLLLQHSMTIPLVITHNWCARQSSHQITYRLTYLCSIIYLSSHLTFQIHVRTTPL